MRDSPASQNNKSINRPSGSESDTCLFEIHAKSNSRDAHVNKHRRRKFVDETSQRKRQRRRRAKTVRGIFFLFIYFFARKEVIGGARPFVWSFVPFDGLQRYTVRDMRRESDAILLHYVMSKHRNVKLRPANVFATGMLASYFSFDRLG
jgi:hypothetical protein